MLTLPYDQQIGKDDEKNVNGSPMRYGKVLGR